jgi:hypothetical protein
MATLAHHFATLAYNNAWSMNYDGPGGGGP